MRKLTFLLACLFMIGVGLVNAQSRSISGKVLSAEDGQPIIGATVMVKGTSTGTITGVDGDFTITIPTSSKILVISYVGMKSQDVEAKANMVVNLESAASELDEVMVVAYGTAKKSTFTGSASVIKADKISKVQSASVSKALEGAVSGVQVVSASGAPGSDASIRIRGIGSINAASNPLYVVDGVPFDGNLTSISQQDIETVTVLKDAAANSMYGSRGANGVILITTKKGDKGTIKVTLDAKYGVTSRGVPNYDVISDPKDYYEMSWESLRNNYYYKLGNSFLQSGQMASSNLIAELGGYNNYDVNGDGIINAIDNSLLINPYTGKLNSSAKLMYQDNWYDEMFKKGIRQDYNASVSGGSDKSNYYFSLGYLNDEGYIVGSGYERYSSRLKLESNVTDKIKVGANFSFSKELIDWIDQGDTQGNNMFYISQTMAPIYPVFKRDNTGAVVKDLKGNAIYDYGDDPLALRPISSMANPVGAQALDINKYDNNIFNGKVFAEVRFLKDFKFTTNLSIDNTDGIRSGYLNGKYGQFAGQGGIASKYVTRNFTMNSNQLLTWVKDFGSHSFDVLVGHELYTNKYNYIYAAKEKFLDPNNIELVGAIRNQQSNSYQADYKTEGFLSRLQYDYADKYFFSASFRRDGSSRFHPDNRWGNFWSTGASWRIDKESFMADVDFVDELKFKASIGTQGNDNLLVGGSTPYATQYNVVANGSDFALVLAYNGNKKIKWENNRSFNTGIDFVLLNEKISGTLEYFSRKTTDMLFSRPLATSSGINSYPDNIGDMINSGFEAELNFSLIKKRNIDWSLSLNATHFTNEITKLPPERKETGIISGVFKLMEGHSVYDYFTKEYIGLNEEGLPLYSMDVVTTTNGVETTTKGTTTDYSEASDYYIGESALPLFYGGVGTSVSAYGFDFSLQTNYQVGGKGYDYTYASLMSSGSKPGENWHKDMFNRWTVNNTNTDIPRLQSGNSELDKVSSKFLVDASYFNIKNIVIGYSLPSKLTKKVNVEKLRVFAVADNVALFSARQGYDPRLSFTGAGNVGQYSASRTISFGINMNF